MVWTGWDPGPSEGGITVPLRGMSFGITGKMSRTRPQMVQLIRENHGIANDEGKLESYFNYLIVGKRIGNGKLNNAERWGVPYITENEFMRLLRGEVSRPRTVSRAEVLDFSSRESQSDSYLYRADNAERTAAAQRTVNAVREAGGTVVNHPEETEATTLAPETPAGGFSISDFFMPEE